MDVDALAAKYGGGSPASKAEPASMVDRLAAKFGGDAITPTTEQQPVSINQGPQNPSDKFVPTPASEMPSGKITQDIKNIADPTEWPKVKKAFKAGQDQFGQGANEIARGMVATGVGNSVLGVAQMFPPITALMAATDQAKETFGKMTGNPKGASNVVDIATIGLPITKTTKAYVKSKVPSEVAIRKLVDDIGVENLPEVLGKLRSNPRLSVADVSDPVRMATQGLVIEPGKHQNTLSKFVEGRQATAQGAVTGAIDDVMGAPVNVVNKLNEMKTAARETGRLKINPIVEGVGPVDITDAIKFIDAQIASNPIGAQTLKQMKAGESITTPLPTDYQNRLFELRQQLRGDWKDRSPTMHMDAKGEQGVHEIQSSLRAEAQKLLDSHDSANHRMGARLMDIREKLVDAIDKPTRLPGQTDGKYKAGLSEYRDDKHVQEAFDKGMDFLKTVKERPEFLESWWKGAKDAEKEALREGVRVALDTEIRTNKLAAKKGTDIVRPDFTRDKLETIFGKIEAREIFRKLQDEFGIAYTNSDLIKGSQTAMRLRANESIKIPEKKAPSMLPLMAAVAEIAGNATGAGPGAGIMVGAIRGGQHIKYKGEVALAKRTNERYTDLVTATGPERDELINKLSAYIQGPKQGLLQQTQNTLRKVIAP